MTRKRDQYQFFWEGTDNPNDPSGVARFILGDESVTVAMNTFTDAANLDKLIERACFISKQQLIDRAIIGLSDLLHRYRYD
jgi:hypothetical protein